jgi:hypothetical protein
MDNGSFNYVVSGDTLQQDLINNTVPETLWQKIYLHLTKLGYEVYAVGQKRDKCENSYVVVKESGNSAMGEGNINGYRAFDIIIYHPLGKYSSMEPYVENIKTALKNITELRPTGTETPSIVDDEVQAYTTSVLYQQFKQLRRI